MNRTKLTIFLRQPVRVVAAIATIVLTLGSVHSVHAINLAQSPLFLARPVAPIVMLNMSNDHQLYFKAYDDYSDLDSEDVGGDPAPETTYKNSYDYYGYFDSNKCYKHSGGAFRPSSAASNHYCSGEWSGNFLNWATMTRIDTVRKILYGGMRSTDKVNETILERAFLPQDAHSFAKYYNGSDVFKLVPGATHGPANSKASGVTICNTTNPSNRNVHSQNVTAPPIMRVASGNYSLWASNERWQCRLSGDVSGSNGKNDNDSSKSGIYAYSSSPAAAADYVVRVEVCNAAHVDIDNNENCKAYAGASLKPAGLLQTYGEDDSILFGLLTGSYKQNKSGGVLRKNVGSMSDEVDANGRFLTPANGESIIETLDKLRIARYDYNQGLYNSADSCAFGLSSFSNGNCTNWGNPQSEMYLESLRYLAGLTPNFSADDSTIISGLKTAGWDDPIGNNNYCAPLSVIQFNASTSSYDGDELGGFTGIAGGKSLNALTDIVGAAEGIHSTSRYVGETASDTNQLCTAKTVSKLSAVLGTCPDAPRLEGSYQIAGLAYHANLNGIADNRETVQTFGVALAPAVPLVKIPVPGSAANTISIQPACRNRQPNPDGNCAIVDFKIVEQNHVGTTHTGKLYVNWEDSEQGGDFDQDMWGILSYEVSSTEVKVTTDVIAQSTPNSMGFGYVIGGTTMDGFHVHSGINNFSFSNEYTAALACNNCVRDNDASEQTFEIGATSASALEQPLYYAAKWGGFETEDEAGNVVDTPTGDPSTYFFATNPRKLEEALKDAFDTIAEGAGSASAVATNSTRLGSDAVAYQATFNTESWSGDLIAANIGEVALGSSIWSAANSMPAANAREIWTHDGNSAVEFVWSNLSGAQRSILNSDDGQGQERLQWVRGVEVVGLKDRDADEVLGDIVSSNPAFAGAENYGFDRSQASGADHYSTFVEGTKASRDKMIYVGANDGMLHAFNAETGVERFAYIPSTVYEQLVARTGSDYGSVFNPHQFSVDGQVFVGDAYINGSWKTILVGTLGAGGKGVFALDVTNPESGLDATKVLFEYNESNAPNIGNVTGTPIIAPMPDGSWAIILGNGYNSQGGEAQLVVIPLDGNYVPTYIPTGNVGDNGLSEPSISVGGGFLSRYAYAGDLQGNMYKFDLQSKTLDYTLFEARDNSGNAQPITAAPVLGINPYRKSSNGQVGTMVYFGTGSYLTVGDLNNTKLQSFYGVADTGAAVSRGDLFEKEITSQSGGSRTVYQGDGQFGDEIDWDTHAGWVLDFDTVIGERVVDKPILSFDRLIFPTTVPTENPCDYGGNSWIMALIGVGQLYPGYSPFAEPPSDPSEPHEPGVCTGDGCETDTLVKLTPPKDKGLPCGGGAFIIQQNSDGSVGYICTGEPDVVEGRQSWRQIQ
ncbi:pilus assembly protein [Gilvimarinus polysaccharolyticus]|uniref:pilus assembly protein n=1 Tax=Gilvimarinus polysaccharolyticus TaxID=863921 RepID=UPI0006739294|nr:PilC/PilY family type IV pilus protein [Gilvimarinus polysaccharolyticus]